MNKIASFIMVLIIFIILILYFTFSWGFVSSILAKWFIYPIFPQFPVLTWLQFSGISFLLTSLLHGKSNTIGDEDENWIKKLLINIFNPWVLLVTAWIFKIIMT